MEKPYNKNFNPDDFVGKWLLDLDKADLTKPSMAIINGFGSTHDSNNWYAQILKKRMGSVFAYDARGQGSSIADGDLDSIQNAIDAEGLIIPAFADLDQKAESLGVKPGPKILEGHCLGALTVAALYGGKFPFLKDVDGVILISPVSTFKLPLIAKTSYFLPNWLGNFVVRRFAHLIAKQLVKGEDSEYSRRKALYRISKMNLDVGFRQARQLFWKENVQKLWKTIDKPALMLVAPNDPLTRIEDTAKVYPHLKYPIWLQLEAPDHLILEENIKYLSEFIPRFCSDPWGVYEEFKHLKPHPSLLK